MVSVAIVGASGYSGQETLDRVLAHPELAVAALGSDTFSGKPVSVLDPRLARSEPGALPDFVTNDAALASGADLLFLCTDHERAAELETPADGVIVDLSGGHRLRDERAYAEWYGWIHPRPAELADWSYGVPELLPPSGRLIANPGCYATAVLLAVLPLTEVVDPTSVIVDAKSGVSGAGRSLRPTSHAGAVLENLVPYRVGQHQHQPEIEQALGFPVCFVPHLLPVRRGLIATCYLSPAAGADVRGLLEARYEGAPAVSVLPDGLAPELARVQGTDAAEIGVFVDRATDRSIVICAIDNLGKGAAGQAIQNANATLGLPATAGLRLSGVLV